MRNAFNDNSKGEQRMTSRKQLIITAAIAGSAFAAGYHSGHLAGDAHAATQEMMPVQIGRAHV